MERGKENKAGRGQGIWAESRESVDLNLFCLGEREVPVAESGQSMILEGVALVIQNLGKNFLHKYIMDKLLGFAKTVITKLH